MQHLKTNESASSSTRIAFRVIGSTGKLFADSFHQLLAERTDLQAFRPELNGSTFSIDATTLAGVADAFDSVVGQAQGFVQHANAVDKEMRQIEDQTKKDALDRFKKSQGL